VELVVTILGRETEPALRRLVEELGAELRIFAPDELTGQPVPTPSDRVEQLTGVPAVAEAADLARGAELLTPKQRSANATVAIRRKVHDLATQQRDACAASLPADRRAAFDGLKIEAILDTPLNIAVTCYPGRGGRQVLGRHADPRTTLFSAAIAIQNLRLAA